MKSCTFAVLVIGLFFIVINNLPATSVKYNSTDNITGSVTSPHYEEVINNNIILGQLSTPDLIRVLVREAGYSRGDQELFVRVAKAESQFVVNVKGYAGNFWGLFQIYDGTWQDNHCIGNILNPVDNTLCAIRIQRSSGWTPWETFTKGLV